MASIQLKLPTSARNSDAKSITDSERADCASDPKAAMKTDVISTVPSSLSRISGDVPSFSGEHFSRCAKMALQTLRNVIVTEGAVGWLESYQMELKLFWVIP